MFFKATSSVLVFLFLTVTGTEYVLAQESDNFKEFKGVVMNKRTKKTLEFATLSVSNTNISSVSNLDGQFNQLDIVAVQQAGKYNTGEAATFGEGDWNGDGLFDSKDLVAALQTSDYVR